jgi:metal-responsive CopG/Arc/MetJ family transcriptional regulator
MTKVLISIPDELLAEIDREAARAGTTRSGYLQAAARGALSTPTHARIADAVARGRDALQSARAFEAAALIRQDRDARDVADRRR